MSARAVERMVGIDRQTVKADVKPLPHDSWLYP
jgi:hypothetical protein